MSNSIRSSSSAWASAACITPRRSRPIPVRGRRHLRHRPRRPARGGAAKSWATRGPAPTRRAGEGSSRTSSASAPCPTCARPCQGGIERREADRLREARRAHQRRGVRDPQADADGRRQGGGQPPAPLRPALPQGQGDHRQRRAGPRPHRLRHGHRLDDAHAQPPDRLHPLVQRRARGRSGSWPRRRPRQVADNHPSPDYIAGFVQFANGVRGMVECGAGAPDQPEVANWWRKCRIGAQGTEGFAEVLTGGGWRAVTKSGGSRRRRGCMNYDLDMPPYIQDMADWLDDDTKVHPAISKAPTRASRSCWPCAARRRRAGRSRCRFASSNGDQART
jgi:hypothetical protein